MGRVGSFILVQTVCVCVCVEREQNTMGLMNVLLQSLLASEMIVLNEATVANIHLGVASFALFLNNGLGSPIAIIV